MSTLATLVVKLIGDVSGFTKDMDTVQSRIDSIGKGMMGLGGRATLGLTTPLVLAANAWTNWASDAVESTNKVNVVFGESAGIVTTFASTSAHSLGIMESAALDSMGTFGNMFTTMGIGRKEAAYMSIDIVKLAADLGSFNNIDPTEMLGKLQSGLVGEIEPLRSVGILMSEAQVKAQAMAMGLGDANGNLTEAEKVQARYALIMQQSTAAQGDFTRTSGELANATRITNALFHDTAAALGEQLLPYKLQLIQLVQRALEAFQGLSPEVQNWIIIIAAGAAALGPLILGLGAVVTALGALLSPIGLVVAAVVALGVAWATNFGGIRDKTQEVIDFVRPYIEAAMNFIRDIVEEVLGKIQAWWAENGETVIQVVTAAWLTIKGAFTEATDFIRGVVEWFLGTVEGWWAQHGNSVMTIVSFLWETIKGIVETISTVISQLLSGFFNAVRGFWEEHGATITGIASNIWETIKGIIQALATVIGGIVDGLAALIQGDWEGLEEAVTAITQGLSDFVTALWTGIKNHITMTLQILVPYIIRAWENIKESVRNKVEVLKSQLAGLWENIKTAAQNKIAEMRDAIVEHIQAMKDRMFGIIHDIISGIIGFFTNTDWGAVGRAVIQGIANGIAAGIEWVKNAARNVAQAAVDAAKAALGIGSPSKVFAEEVGKPIVQGISIGLLKNLGELVQVVGEIAGKVKFEGIKEFSAALKDLFEGLQAVYDADAGVLDGILKHTKPRLIAVIQWFANLWPDIKAAAGDAAAASTQAAEVVRPLSDLFNGMRALYDADAGRMDGILKSIRGQVIAVINWFARLYPEIKDQAADAAASSKAVGEVLSPVKSIFDGMAAIYGATKGKLDGIFASIRDQVISIIDWFARLYPQIQSNAETARQSADAVEAVLASVGKMMKGYGEIMKLISTAAKEEWDMQLDGIFAILRPQVLSIIEWFHKLWGDMEAFAQNAEKTAGVVGEVFEAVKKLFAAMIDVLSDMQTPGVDAGHGLMEAFAQGITEWANLPVEALQAVLQKLRDMLPGSDAKFGPLSDLTASGRALPMTLARGIVRGTDAAEQAAQAMAGRLQPQWSGVATPLPSRASMDNANAGNSTTVNIYNPVGEPSEMSMTRQLRNLAAIGVLTA